MVNVRKVMLADSHPSARTIVATCRECLWGLVEFIKVANESAQNDQTQSDDVDNAVAQADTNLSVCPTGFAGKSQRRRKSNSGSGGSNSAVTPQHKQRGLGGAIIPVLPKSKGDKFVIEENLAMCTYPGDGLMYPARILGNGPASSSPSTSCTSPDIHQSSSCSGNRSRGGAACRGHVQTVMASFLPLEYAAPNQRAACFEVPRAPAHLAPIPASYTKQVRNMLEIERFDTSGDVFAELTRTRSRSGAGGEKGGAGGEKGEQQESSVGSIDAGIDLSTIHEKYWDQRYRLFSKYDRGILLDAESWFSVTPEVISRHIATRCREGARRLQRESGGEGSAAGTELDGAVAMDIFSGCGGNAIALAAEFSHVCASDIDPVKARLLRHNAALYGVGGRVEVVVADAYCLLGDMLTGLSKEDQARYASLDAPQLLSPTPGSNASRCWRLDGPADVLVLAPPWGGSDYTAQQDFDLHTMIPSGDFFHLMKLTRHLASNMVCILPKNTPKRQIEDICTSLLNNKVHPCVVEDVFINGKCKMAVVYFGLLFASSARLKKRQLKESNVAGTSDVPCELPPKKHIRFDETEEA